MVRQCKDELEINNKQLSKRKKNNNFELDLWALCVHNLQ